MENGLATQDLLKFTPEQTSLIKSQIANFKYNIKQIQNRGLVYTEVGGKFRELPKELHDAAKIYDEYFGEEIRGCKLNPIGKKNAPCTINQRIFCKYAIEAGFKTRDIGFLMGLGKVESAKLIRRRFTRSFATNPEYKQAYYRFLQVAQLRQNEQ